MSETNNYMANNLSSLSPSDGFYKALYQVQEGNSQSNLTVENISSLSATDEFFKDGNLHRLVSRRNFRGLRQWLYSDHIDSINDFDIMGRTVLHIALLKNDISILSMLLFPPRPVSSTIFPRMVIDQNQNKNTILKDKIDLPVNENTKGKFQNNEVDNVGSTTPNVYFDSTNNNNNESIESSENDKDENEFFLDFNIPFAGVPPLHLLLQGSRFRKHHNDAIDCLKMILEANPKTLNINAVDPSKATALHLASRIGDYEFANHLLNSNANPFLTDEHQNLPVHLAIDSHSPELLHILLFYMFLWGNKYLKENEKQNLQKIQNKCFIRNVHTHEVLGTCYSHIYNDERNLSSPINKNISLNNLHLPSNLPIFPKFTILNDQNSFQSILPSELYKLSLQASYINKISMDNSKKDVSSINSNKLKQKNCLRNATDEYTCLYNVNDKDEVIFLDWPVALDENLSSIASENPLSTSIFKNSGLSSFSNSSLTSSSSILISPTSNAISSSINSSSSSNNTLIYQNSLPIQTKAEIISSSNSSTALNNDPSNFVESSSAELLSTEQSIHTSEGTDNIANESYTHILSAIGNQINSIQKYSINTKKKLPTVTFQGENYMFLQGGPYVLQIDEGSKKQVYIPYSFLMCKNSSNVLFSLVRRCIKRRAWKCLNLLHLMFKGPIWDSHISNKLQILHNYANKHGYYLEWRIMLELLSFSPKVIEDELKTSDVKTDQSSLEKTISEINDKSNNINSMFFKADEHDIKACAAYSTDSNANSCTSNDNKISTSNDVCQINDSSKESLVFIENNYLTAFGALHSFSNEFKELQSLKFYTLEDGTLLHSLDEISAQKNWYNLIDTFCYTHNECFEHLSLPDANNYPNKRFKLTRNFPENPTRLEVLVSPGLGILRSDMFKWLHIKQATLQVPLADILRVHDWIYIKNLKKKIQDLQLRLEESHQYNALSTYRSILEPHNNFNTQVNKYSFELTDGDTPITANSWQATTYAAGSVIEAIDAVCTKQCRNAFCAIRPPGHHLGSRGAAQIENLGEEDTPSGSQGFCLLNNVAIGAGYAKYTYQRKGIKNIAIIDFDVHHGNGTEQIIRNVGQKLKIIKDERSSVFENESYLLNSEKGLSTDGLLLWKFHFPVWKGWVDTKDKEELFFASIHVYDGHFYPGTGKSCCDENSHIVNVGLSAKESTSISFRANFLTHIVKPLLAFSPDLILLSSGFDGHSRDDVAIGYTHYTEQDFEWVTNMIVKIANTVCDGRIVSVLEGGYNTKCITLSPFASSVMTHVNTLHFTSPKAYINHKRLQVQEANLWSKKYNEDMKNAKEQFFKQSLSQSDDFYNHLELNNTLNSKTTNQECEEINNNQKLNFNKDSSETNINQENLINLTHIVSLAKNNHINAEILNNISQFQNQFDIFNNSYSKEEDNPQDSIEDEIDNDDDEIDDEDDEADDDQN